MSIKLLYALLIASSMMLTACGGGDDTTTTTSNAPLIESDADTEQEQTVEQPIRKDAVYLPGTWQRESWYITDEKNKQACEEISIYRITNIFSETNSEGEETIKLANSSGEKYNNVDDYVCEIVFYEDDRIEWLEGLPAHIIKSELELSLFLRGIDRYDLTNYNVIIREFSENHIEYFLVYDYDLQIVYGRDFDPDSRYVREVHFISYTR